MDKTADSERAFQKAISLSPDCWSCYNDLGALLYSRARYGEAAQAWEKVHELAPDNVWVYENLGAVYFYIGQFEKANEYWTQGLHAAPGAADDGLYSNLGTASFYLGRFADAVDYFQRAVDLKPDVYIYRGNLADAYRMIPGDSAKAADSYAKAIQLAEAQLKVNSRDATALSSLALYLARTHDPTRAKTYIDKALASAPHNSDVLLSACLVQLEAGNRARALAWLRKSVAAGYTKQQMLANPELAALHSDPEFSRLAQEAKSYR